MAKALRVTSVTNHANTSFEVFYLFGDAPLSGGTPESLLFGSKQELVNTVAQVASFSRVPSGPLPLVYLLLALAVYTARTGDVNLTNPAILGKTLTIDFAATPPMSFA